MTEHHTDVAVAQQTHDALVARSADLERERLSLVHEHHQIKSQPQGADVAADIRERERRIARLAELDRVKVALEPELDRARRALHTARIAASREICAAIKLDYVDAVRKLAVALQAAQDAHDAVLAVSEPINAVGVQWHDLVPMAAHQVFGAHGERVREWMRDAKAAGYIE